MASRAPLRLNHRCPVWFHSCRLRVEGKAFRPPFSCAKKPEADDKTVTIPLRAHEICTRTKHSPAPCGLYRPPRRQIFLPASRTSCVRHRADARRPAPRRATPHRRAALSTGKSSSLYPLRAAHDTGPTLAGLPPPAGDAAPKSSLFRCRHRSSAPSGIGRRARLSAPSAQTDGTTAKQPRKRGCLALGLYYLYRRQTAPRQNNPASAVAFALGLYYLYRRQTAPRQNNPASAVAFALGLYYLCQRTNAYPL